MSAELQTAPERRRNRFARTSIALPDFVVVVLLAATIAVSLAVLVRLFTPWFVVPVTLVFGVILWRCVPSRPKTQRFDTVASIVALVFAIGWVLVNAHYASQLLDATRDPSMYTLSGIWLSGHESPGIDITGARAAFGDIPGFTADLGNIGAGTSPAIVLQGGSTLPALLATGGWAFGVPGVLAGNTVLGGIALISVFGLARRVMPPLFALAAQVALGLSITMMYLSRATYSETLMLAVCAAGLTWMIAAFREHRVSLWIVSGVFLGSAGFARIDGAISIVGPMAALAVAVFLIDGGPRLRGLIRGIPWFVLAALLTLGLGIAALALNQRGYLEALLSQAGLLWGATAATTVVLLIAVLIRGRAPRARMNKVAVAVVAIAGTIVSAGVFLYWLSRPLWMVARHTSLPYQGVIAWLQEKEGLPIDPSRSYDEMTLSWVGWYFGWPTVALAGIGLAVMIFVGVRRRSVPLLVIAASTATVALLYITRVSITPDQAWAYRRLLPIITPGLLIAALYPLWLAWRAVRGRAALRTVAVVGALLVAFVPVVTWNSLLRVSDGRGMSAFVASMCDSIDGDTVLYVTDGAPPYYQVALRTVCGVSVISDTPDTTEDDYAQLASRNPGLDVLVFADGAMPGATDLGTPDGSGTIDRWEATLMRLPQTIDSTSLQFWSGTLDASGQFVER